MELAVATWLDVNAGVLVASKGVPSATGVEGAGLVVDDMLSCEREPAQAPAAPRVRPTTMNQWAHADMRSLYDGIGAPLPEPTAGGTTEASDSTNGQSGASCEPVSMLVLRIPAPTSSESREVHAARILASVERYRAPDAQHAAVRQIRGGGGRLADAARRHYCDMMAKGFVLGGG
jgi:hypothetical protein